jgi:hypothetical protein
MLRSTCKDFAKGVILYEYRISIYSLAFIGNLEQYDAAVTKCEIHMDAVNKERKVRYFLNTQRNFLKYLQEFSEVLT